jgi:hypothetical protein
MGEPPSERYSTFNSKGFCQILQTLSLWAVTDYGEVRCTGPQKLCRTPQGKIASLKRDEAAHKNQLELPITRGAGSRSFLEEGGIDPNLCRNEKKLFPMHSQLRVCV